MSLFGAATSGVDPQTGSYLSNKQRIAMFRASQGRGDEGGGAGGNSGGGASGARVSPQSSIVVVKKLDAITKTLSTNFTESTNQVAQQVAENKRNIDDLYRYVYKRDQGILAAEKKETRDARIEAENTRLKLREKLVEGFSAVAAAAAIPIRAVVDAVAKPMMGFFERLLNALLLLTAAWGIKNLPSILATLEEFDISFGNVKKEIGKFMLGQRGWGSALEMAIRSILRKIKNIAQIGFDVASFIVRKGAAVIGRVFGAIKSFTTKIIRGLVDGVKRVYGSLINQLNRLRPRKPPTPDVPETPKAPKGLFGRLDDMTGNVGSRARDYLGNQFSRFKNTFSEGFDRVKNFTGKVADKINPVKNWFKSQGMKEATQQQKDGWLKRALAPIVDKFNLPSGLATKFLKTLKNIPLLGIGIDIAINKGIAGQDWTEAIVRRLFSGGFGAIGATAGAAAGKVVGAAAGTALIPVPGLGTAVGMGLGGALGGLIGSMLAGFLGDKIGAMSYEGFTGMDATDNPAVTDDQINSITDTVKSTLDGDKTLGAHTHSDKERIQMTDMAKNATNGLSTPEGMEMPSGSSTEVTMTELPPITTQIPVSRETTNPQPEEVERPPALSAVDDEMDQYRAMAVSQYQLA